MLNRICNLFRRPALQSYTPGVAVNHVLEGGHVTREGVVIGQTRQSVLVEWIRGGSSWVSARELAVISI